MKEEDGREGCFYNVMERFPFSSEGPPSFIPLPSKETVAAAENGRNNLPTFPESEEMTYFCCGAAASLGKETSLHDLTYSLSESGTCARPIIDAAARDAAVQTVPLSSPLITRERET